MEISKLEKEINFMNNTAKISVEITIEKEALELLKYHGLDMIPDDMIPSVLVAVGSMYKGRIKNGKIKERINSLV
jgi:hypothetical protein